jgi:hypothetical protein
MIVPEQVRTVPTVSEPTAWLRSTSRRRVIQLSRQHVPAAAFGNSPPIVVAYLADNHVEPGCREDRTCDRCRRYCPPGSAYAVSAHLTDYRGRRYCLVVGLCVPCGQLEQPGDRRFS